MRNCRMSMGLAVTLSISIGLAGCGGAPATGEMSKSAPDDAAKKRMLDDYMKTMVKPKGKKGKAR